MSLQNHKNHKNHRNHMNYINLYNSYISNKAKHKSKTKKSKQNLRFQMRNIIFRPVGGRSYRPYPGLLYSAF